MNRKQKDYIIDRFLICIVLIMGFLILGSMVVGFSTSRYNEGVLDAMTEYDRKELQDLLNSLGRQPHKKTTPAPRGMWEI